MKIPQENWTCIGNFMDCQLCISYQKCHDKDIANGEDLRHQCVTCKRCQTQNLCALITLTNIQANKYLKLELMELFNKRK